MRTIFSILRRLQRDRRGTIAIVFALALVPMIAFIGVSVDYARLVHMKTTLQAAADSAAISGAAANYGSTTQETDPKDGPYAIATNYFNNAWLPPNISVQVNIPPPTITPLTSSPSGATVTVTATAQVAPSFLAIWRSQIPVSVTATATVFVPQTLPGTFPFAITSCLFGEPAYWDSNTNTPALTGGKPTSITLYSSYVNSNKNPDPCLGGQWTTLTGNSQSASLVSDYLSGSKSCNCPITAQQDPIYFVQSGTEATLYGDAQEYFAGKTIYVPVVSGLITGSSTPVTSFAGFHITSADQATKTITGYLTGFNAPGASIPGGVYTGVDHVALIN